MKKILIAAAVALCFAGNAFAQENAGGNAASNSAFGDMKKEKIVGGVVGAGILAAMIANNRGNTKAAPGDGPDVCGDGEVLVDGECVPEPEPVCAGEDPLVDGVCTGTTTTVTVTATGTGTTTGTATITVPVTFTYLPTI